MRYKIYGIVLFIVSFAAIHEIPNGKDFVPAFIGLEYPYTYQMMWYNVWVRILAACFAGFLWWECKDDSGHRDGLLVFIFTLAVCKVTDESSKPFINFPFSEQIAWIIAALTTYFQ